MRILDVDAASAAEAQVLSGHLIEGEVVHAAFVSATGAVLFTGRRILLIQREHLLDARVETTSYPYREVRHFSMLEVDDGRSAIRIWIGDEPQPLNLRARPGTDFAVLQRLLTDRVS